MKKILAIANVRSLLRPRKISGQYLNPKGRPWLTIRNEAKTEAAEIMLEGPIGANYYDDTGNSSKQFRHALASIPKGRKVLVRIHSEGGSVGDALAIHNLIKEHEDAHTRVDGYALSSGSIIAIAGRTVKMPHASVMMIHDPRSFTDGDAEEHRKAMEMLETHADAMAEMYAKRTGQTAEAMRAKMLAESWFTGAEAIAEGLGDPDGSCPTCGHEFCPECTHNGIEAQCSDCGAKASIDEWMNKDPDSDASALAKIQAIDFSKFPKATQSVLALAQISPGAVAGGVAGTPPGLPNPTIMNPPTALVAAAAPPVQPPQPQPLALAPVAPPSITPEEAARLRADLEAEKKLRIESKLDRFIDEQRLSNEERPDALARALIDPKYLDVIAKRPPVSPLAEPMRDGPRYDLTVAGNVFDQIRDIKPNYSHPVGGDEAVAAYRRNEFRIKNWAELYTQAKAMDNAGRKLNRPVLSNPNVRFCEMQLSADGSARILPIASSTYSTSLVVDILADGAITQLVNVLAPLRVFTRDFMPSPFMPLNTLQVRLVTQGGQLTKTGKATGTVTTTQTDYESGDHTVTNVGITMYEYSEAFFVASQELMSGLRIEFLANHALQSLGSTIISDTLTLLNDQTFTGGVANGSFTTNYGPWTWNSGSATKDMAYARAQLGKSGIKNAVLDPVLFSKLITIPVATQMQVGMPLATSNTMRNIMGWDEIAETTAWGTGQGAGGSTASYPQPIIGFICNPQAIAAAARLPLLPPEGVPGNTITMAQVTIPGIDLTVAIFQWFSLRYRTLWHSFGVVYGSKQGDLTAGCVIKSLGA
jgi:ATP-dependent protease ClpP protease subunit